MNWLAKTKQNLKTCSNSAVETLERWCFVLGTCSMDFEQVFVHRGQRVFSTNKTALIMLKICWIMLFNQHHSLYMNNFALLLRSTTLLLWISWSSLYQLVLFWAWYIILTFMCWIMLFKQLHSLCINNFSLLQGSNALLLWPAIPNYMVSFCFHVLVWIVVDKFACFFCQGFLLYYVILVLFFMRQFPVAMVLVEGTIWWLSGVFFPFVAPVEINFFFISIFFYKTVSYTS